MARLIRPKIQALHVYIICLKATGINGKNQSSFPIPLPNTFLACEIAINQSRLITKYFQLNIIYYIRYV